MTPAASWWLYLAIVCVVLAYALLTRAFFYRPSPGDSRAVTSDDAGNRRPLASRGDSPVLWTPEDEQALRALADDWAKNNVPFLRRPK